MAKNEVTKKGSPAPRKKGTVMKKAWLTGVVLGLLGWPTDRSAEVGAVLGCLSVVAEARLAIPGGTFVLPGVVTIKKCQKAATKDRIMKLFGKEVLIKAKAAKTVLKADVAKALKDPFC